MAMTNESTARLAAVDSTVTPPPVELRPMQVHDGEEVAWILQDMRALIVALSAGEAPASFLLPTRQGEVFRWCLDAGLRVVKPMTYMTVGEHRDPSGAWIPSVLY